MRITQAQLRQIIREEVCPLVESKGVGALRGVKSPRARKIKLGDIFKDGKGGQISVEFLEGGFAGWELLRRGKPRSVDGTVEELQNAIADGGFEFDRNEQAY